VADGRRKRHSQTLGHGDSLMHARIPRGWAARAASGERGWTAEGRGMHAYAGKAGGGRDGGGRHERARAVAA
jgi:hypothetical protein